MKKIFLLPFVLLTLLVSSCGTTSTVPITGRQHTLLVDDAQVLSLSTQQYSQYMQTAKASTNKTNTELVKRVGTKLATAVESYLKNNGFASEVNNFAWEFNLVADNEVNAFCMPGGKIVVYEGLLPVTQDEASLAVVLGHEIAHAVAKHSAEQMSTQLKQQYGAQILSGVLSSVSSNQTVNSLANLATQMGFSFASLKYSRDNETEADIMGLIFVAMAGYDPQSAIPFWQRMAASTGSNSGSDLFSDHPSDAKRIASLQQAMPQALKYYTPAPAATKTTTATKSKTTTTKSKTTTTKKTGK